MSKKIKKISSLLIVFMLLLGSFKFDTNAAGGLSISASASQVSSGGTFTVTVQAASNCFVSNLALSVSGGTVVSGLGAASLDRGETTSAKIKLTGDTCVVSVSGVGANYDTETEGPASASVSVRKKAASVNNTTTNTKSKDNNLSALTVSEGMLSPNFSSDVTEYSVNLSSNVDKVTLGATANDTKASVTGIGEFPVVPGDNRLVIVCTAENGSKKEYVVNVHVDEAPTVFGQYGEQQLGVVKNQADIGIPATFEKTSVSLDGQEVEAYHSNQMDMTLIYMVSETGDKNFYMYDEVKGITSIYRPVTILGRNVILFDLTEEEKNRENMVCSEVTIDGVTLYGWTYEDKEFANYIQILVMNEFGDKVLYQYEKTENSLQLYKEYVPVKETEEEEKDAFLFQTYSLEAYVDYIIIGLLGLCVVLIVWIIIMASTRKSKHSTRKRRYLKKLEKIERKQQKKEQE